MKGKIAGFIFFAVFGTRICFSEETYVPKNLFQIPKAQYECDGWGFDDNDDLYLMDEKSHFIDVFDKAGKLKKQIDWPARPGVIYSIAVSGNGKILLSDQQGEKFYQVDEGGGVVNSFYCASHGSNFVWRGGSVYSMGDGKKIEAVGGSGPASLRNYTDQYSVQYDKKKSEYQWIVSIARDGLTRDLYPDEYYGFDNILTVDEAGNVYILYEKVMYGDSYGFDAGEPTTVTYKTCKYDPRFEPLACFDGFVFVDGKTQNAYQMIETDGTYKFLKFEKEN